MLGNAMYVRKKIIIIIIIITTTKARTLVI